MTIIVNAQNNDLIIGKWIFKDAFNKENIDKEGLEFMKSEVIKKMTFDFDKNGMFEAYMMGEIERGKWKLSQDSKKIIMYISEGPPTEFTILKLTKNELALKLGLGEFLMKKTHKKGNSKYKEKEKPLVKNIKNLKNIEIDKSELIDFELIEEIPLMSECDSNLNQEKFRECFNKSIRMHISRKFNANLAANLGLATGVHTITTTFVITKRGEIVNIKSEGSNPILNNEAVRVSSLLPKMKPGKSNEILVNVEYSFPIKFRVE